MADSERLALADRLDTEHQHRSPWGTLGCTCPVCPDLRAAAHALREAEAWKSSAMKVLAEWDEVFDALGRPGKLGASKAESSLAEVERLVAGYLHTAPLPADADAVDTRQEVEALVESLRGVGRLVERASSSNRAREPEIYARAAELLAAAYLGRTD